MVAMPDADPSPPSQAAKRLHDYPIGTLPATPSLQDLLRERITRDGPLSFPDFMTAALYEPGLGYYARQTRQIGRRGDFFTSVSVGPLFGELLARRFLRQWLESSTPPRWRIIECGAHDGRLAADVLDSLSKLDQRSFEALEYVIPEPLPVLQAAQRDTLHHLRDRVRFIIDPLELAADPLPGIAFGNEWLDALPCHLVERDGDEWLERRVAPGPDGGWIWQTAKIHDPLLHAALAPLGGDFPNGYRTEVRTCYPAMLAPLVRGLQSALMIWIDYGFARPDYYHPHRTAGTLRTFSQHRAGDNPLDRPGETDITAHVDFTAVAETAHSLGGHPTRFQNQGAWLTATAHAWLLEQDGQPQPSFVRPFQTLTHPAHLGGRFQVLELAWNPAEKPLDHAALTRHLFGTAPAMP
jgi:SAM-dependent MidA family methyltransferase